MKKLIMVSALIAASLLTGCAEKVDGLCAVSVDGVCVGEYHNGEVVAVGSVDMRYTGLKQDADGNFYGTVSTSVKSWK